MYRSRDRMTPRQFIDALYDNRPPKVPAAVLRALRLYPGLTAPNPNSPFSRLPRLLQKLLTLSNGLDILSGSYRLFGLGGQAPRDMVSWNQPDTWKFSWGERAAPYFCFGESVLGNQFAFRESEMRADGPTPVYELYAVTLYEITKYASFDAFLDLGFFNGVSDDAYHQRIAQARSEMGKFDFNQHLAFMPSPLLNAGEVANLHLMPMTARAHMIVNGDLWSQLAHRDSLEGLQRIENYQDDEGRPRLRAVFA
jgi:hypothetical protein